MSIFRSKLANCGLVSGEAGEQCDFGPERQLQLRRVGEHHPAGGEYGHIRCKLHLYFLGSMFRSAHSNENIIYIKQTWTVLIESLKPKFSITRARLINCRISSMCPKVWEEISRRDGSSGRKWYLSTRDTQFIQNVSTFKLSKSAKRMLLWKTNEKQISSISHLTRLKPLNLPGLTNPIQKSSAYSGIVLSNKKLKHCYSVRAFKPQNESAKVLQIKVRKCLCFSAFGANLYVYIYYIYPGSIVMHLYNRFQATTAGRRRRGRTVLSWKNDLSARPRRRRTAATPQGSSTSPTSTR